MKLKKSCKNGRNGLKGGEEYVSKDTVKLHTTAHSPQVQFLKDKRYGTLHSLVDKDGREIRGQRYRAV